MIRSLLIGHTGFVGKSILSVPSKAYSWDLVSSRSSNLPNQYSWNVTERCILPEEYSLMLHAATPASALLNATDPDAMLRQNVSAMENVIEFAARHEHPPIVLFTSSGAVYGDMPEYLERFPEGWERPASSPPLSSSYAEGKVIAEEMLRQATRDGKCVGLVARLFAFSGIHLPLDRHFAIGNFVRDVVLDQRITIRGNGSPIRSYLDGQDMAEWLFKIIENGSTEEVYHVGSERAISIKDLAILIGQRYELLTDNSVDIDILDQSSPLDGVSRYVPSTERTRSLLELKENIALEESIDQMILHGMKTYGKTISD